MSATTSPRATIFPKLCSCRRRRSDPYLAEGPYLLVGVSGLPQRCDHVAPEVWDVADYEARLPLRNQAHLARGGRQDARLGTPELLGSSVVLYPHRVPNAGERETASGVGRHYVRLGKGPALEGEVRTRAAEDTARFACFQK